MDDRHLYILWRIAHLMLDVRMSALSIWSNLKWGVVVTACTGRMNFVNQLLFKKPADSYKNWRRSKKKLEESKQIINTMLCRCCYLYLFIKHSFLLHQSLIPYVRTPSRLVISCWYTRTHALIHPPLDPSCMHPAIMQEELNIPSSFCTNHWAKRSSSTLDIHE